MSNFFLLLPPFSSVRLEGFYHSLFTGNPYCNLFGAARTATWGLSPSSSSGSRCSENTGNQSYIPHCLDRERGTSFQAQHWLQATLRSLGIITDIKSFSFTWVGARSLLLLNAPNVDAAFLCLLGNKKDF